MWQDLTIYQIKKIDDINKRREYERKYHIFIYGISLPICTYLEKNGLSFKYSKSQYQLTVRQMSEELKNFCESNFIDEEMRHKIINGKR